MKLRQLPELYLRGSFVNETIRNLTAEQRRVIDEWHARIRTARVLAGNKYEFVTKLGQTIGGDYHDDRAAAEAEYDIAIWRALVYLLYHSDYTFQCRACGAVEYHTQKSRLKGFDRRYPICPACGCVRITASNIAELPVGAFVKHADVQQFLLANAGQTFTLETASPVSAITGKKKVADPMAVLRDDDQLRHYFSEFVWNYFRQVLNENIIEMHNTEPRLVTGPADAVLVEELLSLFGRAKVDCPYQPRANPNRGRYSLPVNLNGTRPDVSLRVMELVTTYGTEYGVETVITDNEILVTDTRGSAPLRQAYVVKPEVVTMHTKAPSIDGNDADASAVDALQHHMTGVCMRYRSTHDVESDEALDRIRASLPEAAQRIFDILTERGEAYSGYMDWANTTRLKAPPHNTQIASYLGISPRQVTAHIATIKAQCLANHLIEV